MRRRDDTQLQQITGKIYLSIWLKERGACLAACFWIGFWMHVFLLQSMAIHWHRHADKHMSISNEISSQFDVLIYFDLGL